MMALRFDREPNVWPVFTDVMMGIIFIFLILVIATNDSSARKVIYDDIGKRKSNLADMLHEIAAKSQYIGPTDSIAFQVERSQENKLTLIFNSSMLFDVGDHRLKNSLRDPIAEPIINEISSVLQDYQFKNKNKGFHEIIIEGHTDGTKFKHYFDYGNWGLSADRANEVLMRMSRKIDGKYLSPRGYANMRPRLDKSGEALKSDDQRRIEITIIFNPDSVKMDR
jgi:flagellar motor protein MotB